jgi:hypothetical protein
MMAGTIRQGRPGAPRRPRGVVAGPGGPGAAADRAVRGLGTWQVQRLQWKLDLIDAWNTRARRPGRAAPVARWSHQFQKNPTNTGAYASPALPLRIHDAGAGRVRTGRGFWLLTPLCTPTATSSSSTAASFPLPARTAAIRRAAPAAIPARRGHAGGSTPDRPAAHQRTGGGFLRDQRPGGNRWFRATSPRSPPRAAWRSRAVLRRRGARPDPRARRSARRRPDGHFLPKQSPRVCDHLVCSCFDGGGAWWYVARPAEGRRQGKERWQ